MNGKRNIQKIIFENSLMILTVNSRTYRIDLKKVSPKLAKADEFARNNYEISPSGYGIHWLQLDEDLSVDGLIKSAAKHDYSLAKKRVRSPQH